MCKEKNGERKYRAWYNFRPYGLKAGEGPGHLSVRMLLIVWMAITCTAGAVRAQDTKVTGKITGVDGNALPGVNIMIKGGTRGTSSGTDGTYSLNVSGPNTVLTFSFIGYVSQEIAVGGKNVLDVTMKEDVTQLGEVVVTALGIERAAKSLTYATQTIKASSLNEAKETNVINSLQGKVAGVVISRSATGPGGSSKVLLRGNRSITGTNEPLYVIDGVPLNSGRRASGGGSFGDRDGGGGISMLNPDNIESMTILRGASAAALYGSAGQNGAIVITTKSGKAGKLTVDYNGGVTFDKAISLPKRQTEYGQGDYNKETNVWEYKPDSEHSYGPKLNENQQVTLWNGHSVPYKAHPDNIKNFFRTATTYNNSISVTGGGEKMRTFFSYGHTKAQGILRNNDMTRHNVDLKIDNTISKRLSFTTKVSYIYQEINNMPHTGERGYALSSIYRSPVSIPLEEMKQFNYFDQVGTEKQNYWKPGSSILSNPYWNLNREIFFEKKDRVLGLFSARYEFNDWINLMVRGSIDKTLEKTENKIYNDTYTTYGLGSNYIVGDYMRQSTNLDALLSLKKDLSKDLNLSVNLGGAVQAGSGTTMTIDANGLYKHNFFFLTNAKNPAATSSRPKSAEVQSVYGTATLSFRDNLFLDVTARNDWSSALPAGKWSYFYPSVGLTGVVSEMVKLPEWVSYGKLRVSLAGAGSGGGAYLDRNYYTLTAGGLVASPVTMALPTYKPEITSNFEVGAEWRFLQGRFGFDVTYYNTLTKNQLIVIAMPAASMFSNRYINAGLIRNRGVEATVNLVPLRLNDFEWEMAFNYSKNVNRVIRLTDEVKRIVLVDDRQVLIRVDEGGRYGDMFGTGWRRDEQGRHLVSSKGLPELTPSKDLHLGNFNPNYNLGFSNTFSYKGISLGFLLDYRNGGTVIAGTQALLDADGHSEASLWGREGGILLDGVTLDGKPNEVRITPQEYFLKIGERYPAGEFYAYSGTNLRLRELTLGYSLKPFLKSSGLIQDARIAFVGRNLFFLKKYAPFDPEVTSGTGNYVGIEYNSLPSTRNIGFNIKLSF